MKIKIKRNARAMSPTPTPPPTAVGSGSEGILCRAHADEDLIVVWSGRAAADRASASCSLRRLRPFAFLPPCRRYACLAIGYYYYTVAVIFILVWPSCPTRSRPAVNWI